MILIYNYLLSGKEKTKNLCRETHEERKKDKTIYSFLFFNSRFLRSSRPMLFFLKI